MAVILEVKAGALTGKRVAVMGGQRVTVGRTARANFAVPHDTFMSGLHFSVEYGPKGCLLTDQKSSNGTFVNGARVTQALLKTGDEVRSGQTIFSVRVVEEEPALPVPKAAVPPISSVAPLSPLPVRPVERTAKLDESESRARSASPPIPPIPQPPLAPPRAPGKPTLTVGGWTFSNIPESWSAQGDYGIQREVSEGFPSSVVVTEEPLGNGHSLQQYVEAQLGMLRQYLRDPQIDAALPPKISGAEETIAVDVRYKTKDGQAIFYRRIYSRCGRSVGVLTFTTLENELAQVRPALEAIVAGAGYAPQSSAQS